MELTQTKEGIMSIMIITAAVAIVATVASAIVVSRDGYRRVPTRQA